MIIFFRTSVAEFVSSFFSAAFSNRVANRNATIEVSYNSLLIYFSEAPNLRTSSSFGLFAMSPLFTIPGIVMMPMFSHLR